MLVGLALLDVEALVVDAAALRHLDIEVGVAQNDGVLAISTSEDAEVRRAYLIIYFFPLIGREKVGLGLARQYLGSLVEETS